MAAASANEAPSAVMRSSMPRTPSRAYSANDTDPSVFMMAVSALPPSVTLRRTYDGAAAPSLPNTADLRASACAVTLRAKTRTKSESPAGASNLAVRKSPTPPTASSARDASRRAARVPRNSSATAASSGANMKPLPVWRRPRSQENIHVDVTTLATWRTVSWPENSDSSIEAMRFENVGFCLSRRAASSRAQRSNSLTA